MQQPPEIPLSLVRDLRCCHCQDFLSCGPIHTVPNKGVICGRCKNFAKPDYRNYSLEAIASIFTYPCRNWESHCSRKLTWNGNFEHERNCTYGGSCGYCCAHPCLFCCSSKRKFPTNDIRLQQLPENLLDQVKCSICECYLSCAPVYIQPNGKDICHRCIQSNGPPPSHFQRNLPYEAIASIMIFPCIYRNRGCPTRLVFGRELWKHEATCTHSGLDHQRKKVSKNLSQKERGVIQTHSGHVFGTITPNSVLFAPPKHRQSNDINKNLMKSLKQKQDRRFGRVDDVDHHFSRLNSEDSSIITNSSDGRLNSGRVSPADMDDFAFAPMSPRYPPNKTPSFNNYNNRYPEVFPAPVQKQPSFSRFDPHLAGHFPVFSNNGNISQHSSFNNGNIPMRSDSLSSRDLMNELKSRQQKLFKQNSIKEQDDDSPYRDCKSFQDIKYVHDGFGG